MVTLPSSVKTILFLCVLSVMVVAGVGLWRMVSSGGDDVVIHLDRTAVVTEMRSLQRLETIEYRMEKIIEAGTEGGAFSQVLFGDRLLLIAHGVVIAGVDLSAMSPDDVEISERGITITTPSTEIFLSDLDEARTTVYDRQVGLLTKGNTTLESQARAAAEQSIRQAACEAGVLRSASENARQQLEALLTTFGFDRVSVEVPVGSC